MHRDSTVDRGAWDVDKAEGRHDSSGPIASKDEEGSF